MSCSCFYLPSEFEISCAEPVMIAVFDMDSASPIRLLVVELPR